MRPPSPSRTAPASTAARAPPHQTASGEVCRRRPENENAYAFADGEDDRNAGEEAGRIELRVDERRRQHREQIDRTERACRRESMCASHQCHQAHRRDLHDDDEGRVDEKQRETISLAFITALQLLPPRQRAALILTDVLDFSAPEVVGMLESTEHAIYGAVKRARATLARHLPNDEPPPLPNSLDERKVIDRLVRAWEESRVGTSRKR
jgi:Sigma-70, region 4